MAKLLFFGRLSDAAGRASETLALPKDACTAHELLNLIKSREPALGAALDHPSVRIAVNQRLASSRDVTLSDADEIAFLPPMSGG